MKQQKKGDNNENCVVVVANDDLLISCDKNVVNYVHDESRGLVDSCAIFHVTPRKDLFYSYSSGNLGC